MSTGFEESIWLLVRSLLWKKNFSFEIQRIGWYEKNNGVKTIIFTNSMAKYDKFQTHFNHESSVKRNWKVMFKESA